MERTRRLSPIRVLFAIVMLGALSYGAFLGIQRYREIQAYDISEPWFAPYVDITATPYYPFEQYAEEESQDNVVLSFIVSSTDDPCLPTWGGRYSFDEANSVLDLDRRIARYKQHGGNITVSFGGLLNDELSFKCLDENRLYDAYWSVVNRYDLNTIDLDLEGYSLNNADAMQRRARVISKLQKDLRSRDKNLAVWLTLPAATFGLTDEGASAVRVMLENEVDITGVNIMTMNYGQSKNDNQSMQNASERALIETHRQLGILYKQAGINLSSSTLWAKLGATPMIGQNDIVNEIFALDDAEGLNKFAKEKGINRISMWSSNRDVQCGDNYVNLSIVSDSCSGVKQDKFAFGNKLGDGFGGNITENAGTVTVSGPETIQQPDNPDESPYQIWNENGTYLEGTKVVWHGNVYQAKWWTHGDMPDNPVLQSWETPWELIGPVLPGEKLIPQPTLAPGTYPLWSGTAIYEEGDRVLFEGVPYQAKWWTQGDSPAAASSNSDASPWVPLTFEQIKEVIKKR